MFNFHIILLFILAGFSVVNSGIENSLSSGIVPMYDGFRDGKTLH